MLNAWSCVVQRPEDQDAAQQAAQQAAQPLRVLTATKVAKGKTAHFKLMHDRERQGT